MSDIKTYECFPTIITGFSLNISHEDMKEEIERLINGKDRRIHFVDKPQIQDGSINLQVLTQTEDNLHKNNYFITFVKEIFLKTKLILDEQGLIYDDIEITGMWANEITKGKIHAPHTHSNNFLSGVYYLHAPDNTSPIQFFDPRPQASIFRPYNNMNFNQADLLSFKAKEGIGYIFPSWLMHWVPESGNDKRVSISWNIIVRGAYGQPNSLQNANI